MHWFAKSVFTLVLALALSLSASFACAEQNKDYLAEAAKKREVIDNFHEDGDYKNAAILADELIELGKINNDPVVSAHGVREHAFNALYTDNFDEALKLFGKANNTYLEYNVKLEVAATYRQIGTIYRIQTDYVKALDYFTRAKTIYQELNDAEGISHIVNNFGVLMYYLGQYEQVLEYGQKTLETSYQLEDHQGVATALFNLGDIRMEMGDLDIARDYLLQALELDKEYGSVTDIGHSYLKVGQLYIELGELDDADASLENAVDFFRQAQSERLADSALTTVAKIAMEQGKLEQADDIITGVIERAIENDYQSQLGDAYYTAATIALEMQNFAEAESHIEKGIALTKEHEERKKESLFEELKVKLYQATNDFQLAFEALQRQKAIDDDVFNTARLGGIVATQSQAEFVRRAHQIELLEKDNQLKVAKIATQKAQRNLYFAAFGTVLIMLMAMFYVMQQRRNLDKQRAEMMEELVEQKNQLLADVSHELRTPLTALHLRVEALQDNLVEDVDATYEKLQSKIGDINRMISDIYQLAQSDIGALNLQIHEENAAGLLNEWSGELQDQAEAKGFKWQFQNSLPEFVPVSIDKDRIKQVLVNLIGNSVAYTNVPGIIGMAASVQDNNITISVFDSAPGVDEKDLPRLFERLFRVDSSRSRATGGSGLGLAICKSTIEAHGGNITAEPSEFGGLLIMVSLPMTSEVAKI